MHNKKIIASGLAIGLMVSNIPIESMAKTTNEYKLTKIEKQRDAITSKSKKTIKANKEPRDYYTYKEVTLNEGEFLTLDMLTFEYDFGIKINTVGDKKLVQQDYDVLKEHINNHVDYIEAVDLSGSRSDFIPNELFKPMDDYSLSYLREFKFPQGVKTIGDYAFYYCDSLIGDLIIPDTVTSIGSYAFYYCTNLEGNLVIPSSVITIGDFAFHNCNRLTGSLLIPNSVTSIGNFAFSSCRSLTGNLAIPNSVTTIGNSAFSFCKGLNGTLTIPDSVTSINQQAFYMCSGLTGDLIIPDSVTSIGISAFNGCSGLTGDLIIPDGVTKINNTTFKDCTGLTGSLIIPSGVTSIGNGAFSGCSGLTGNLVIPDSVTSIGTNAFENCAGFTGNLTIPDSVTSIGNYIFDGCSGFTGNLIIPNKVKTIGTYSFRGCIGFDGDLIIPDSVTRIDSTSFNECTNIKNAIITISLSDTNITTIESVYNQLSSNYETIVEIPHDFNIGGTWIETTSPILAQINAKSITDGVELYIPSIYEVTGITATKDGEEFVLPEKNIEGKYILTEVGVYEIEIVTNLRTSTITFEIEDVQLKNAEEAVNKAIASKDLIDISEARILVNNLPECIIKDQLQEQLNNIFPKTTFEKKTATSNVDVYIKSENSLHMTLSTNSITFEDFSGVNDMIKENAVKISINSSLPYSLNAYLETEIQNADKQKTMTLDILNIKENSEVDYQTFENTTDKVVLKDNNQAGNDLTHNIDFKLKGGLSFEKDVYKTTIKFEAEQK